MCASDRCSGDTLSEGWGLALMQRGEGREAGEVYTGVVLEGGFAIGRFDLVGSRGAVEI